ncbi:hypothetical protein [Escherichia coli]|uniref:hypothetical protein n=1 Tax=Escherichia coli TaxID=562 RepID=UPI0034DB044C
MLNGDNTDENKQPNLGKDVASATNKDKAELGGAGAGTPGGWGPDNEEKARHQEIQQQRFDELSKIYDKSHPVGELTVDGQTIRQSSVSGTIISHLSQMEKSLPDPLPDPIQRQKKKG